MSSSLHPKARSEGLVIQNLADETLVFDITANEAHCLNQTAAFVWGQCTGEATVDEMAAAVEKRFGHRVSTDFVRLAIGQLGDRSLLSINGSDFLPMHSRRSAIKKISLGSAVAVPVIASLVTPANVFAAVSCGACTSPASCFAQPGCPANCNANGICAL